MPALPPPTGPDASTLRTAPLPSTAELFAVFTRIGLTSFGGGLSGWLHREFVQKRGWLAEDEFLNGLSIAQALPGVNVSNMAIWIGYRLRGLPGALASLAGIVAPAAVGIVLLSEVFAALSPFPATRFGLDGAAAAAVGLSMSMGITVARRVPRRAAPLLTMVGTFVAVAVLHWPLVLVVPGAGALSVALEWARLARGKAP